MPGVTLQSTRFRNQPGLVIRLDVDKRKADTEPALTSVHWSDRLTTYVHDPILAQSAKAWKLEFQPWVQLAARVVRGALATNSLIGGYSIPERDLLMAACPEDAEWIKANYLNANAARWFKKHQTEVYAEACRLSGKRGNPGLKDFLIQPAIGYRYPKYLRDVQPGAILGQLRKLLAKREGAHRELTRAAKRDWRNLIEYNRQDVLGMIPLVEHGRRDGTV